MELRGGTESGGPCGGGISRAARRALRRRYFTGGAAGLAAEAFPESLGGFERGDGVDPVRPVMYCYLELLVIQKRGSITDAVAI